MRPMAKYLSQAPMDSTAKLPRVELYRHCGVTAELRKTMHSDRRMPPHFHDEYQIILGTHAVIEYRYRRAPRRASVGALFVAEPGEVHSAEVMENSMIWEPLRTFLITPSTVGALLRDGKPSSYLPCFKSPVIEDHETFLSMLSLHKLLSSEPDGLILDTALLTTLKAFFVAAEISPERKVLRSSQLLHFPQAPDENDRVCSELEAAGAKLRQLSRMLERASVAGEDANLLDRGDPISSQHELWRICERLESECITIAEPGRQDTSRALPSFEG